MKATRESFGEHIISLGKKNNKIIVLDADLGSATKTEKFGVELPKQFVNVGIAEQNMVGMANGLAKLGFIPIATSFAIFLTGRAYEIIRNSVAYSNSNVKIVATHAGITVGYDGGSHQSIEDIALMNVIPRMTVLAPADDIETKSMLDFAVSYNGPVYIRLGRINVSNVNKDEYKFELGRATILREGEKLAIMSYGIMIDRLLSVIEELNLNVRLINMSSLKPIDRKIITDCVTNFSGIITVEEHSVIGGLGDIVAPLIANHDISFLKIGIDDKFGQSGDPEELLKFYSLDTTSLKERIIKFYNELQ